MSLVILTRADGVPFERPQRGDYPPDLEGGIAYADAFYAYNDRVSSYASIEFAKAFTAAMRGKRAPSRKAKK